MKPVKKSNEKPKIEKSVPPAGAANANGHIYDPLRTNLAIGTITLIVTLFILYFLNYTIYTSYNPDINAILDKLGTISFVPRRMFHPEPVERLQFQLSLILSPLIIFGVFTLVNKKKQSLADNPSIAMFINIIGIAGFLFLMFLISSQDLLYVPNETTAYFFANDLIRIWNPILVFILFCFLTAVLFVYTRSKESPAKKIVINAVAYGLVLIVITDIVLYNVFNLSAQETNGTLPELNAVFYSVTQIFAGKSILVNINSQYGMFGWLLCPILKITGLSIYKFAMIMGILTGSCYLFIYLGLKRIIKNDLLSLIVFLCLVFWNYWQVRLPIKSYSTHYFQYWPVRFFFPSLVFFLLVMYQSSSKNIQRILLPVIALSSSIAILWNLDSGVVVFGAALIALVFSTLDAPAIKDSIKRSVVYAAWMCGAFIAVLVFFMVSTRMHSGSWPDFSLFIKFQNIFYVSGFTMLAMSPIHFWNLPVIVYLITCIYCVYNLKKTYQTDLPVIVFLFILGGGAFAYFQGRSYDTTVTIVMYPAIMLAGIFCSKLLAGIPSENALPFKIKFHESIVILLIPFFFLAEGASSMVWHMPSIHTYALANAKKEDTAKDNNLLQKISFVTNTIPRKDTVFILSRDFESYYYSAGNYYNPLNLSGSTEIFLWSELYTPIELIRTTKYPIIFDASHPWLIPDTIVQTLAKFTTIEKVFGSDNNLLLLKPGKKQAAGRLAPGPGTIYYNDLGEFGKYSSLPAILNLPDNFTLECYITLDSTRLVNGNILFTNASNKAQNCGIVMMQNGPDLSQYVFVYGNGSQWCSPAVFKLSSTGENHIVIKVQKNIITAYNNNIPLALINTGTSIKNSDGKFKINPSFSGTVNEFMISTP